jgi:hypothetical protein
MRFPLSRLPQSDSAPETLRSPSYRSLDDLIVEALLDSGPCEPYESEPMTVRAPYTMAIVAAEMGA